MPRRKGSARTEKASAARRGEAASADGDAAVAEEPVLESNDEPQGMQLDDATDDPVGRRIDDVLTTAQTFDVAGFGEVRSLWPRTSLLRLCHWANWGG